MDVDVDGTMAGAVVVAGPWGGGLGDLGDLSPSFATSVLESVSGST